PPTGRRSPVVRGRGCGRSMRSPNSCGTRWRWRGGDGCKRGVHVGRGKLARVPGGPSQAPFERSIVLRTTPWLAGERWPPDACACSTHATGFQEDQMDDESKQLLREIRDLLAGQARHRDIDFETLQKVYTEQDHKMKQLMRGATWRFYVASFVVFF